MRVKLIILFIVAWAGVSSAVGQQPRKICPKSELVVPTVVMAVIGDSLTWGQGLQPWNKSSCRTKQWLEGKTGRPVEVNVYAHAGAVIDGDTADEWEKKYLDGKKEAGSEVNVSFPTILSQVDAAKRE